MFTVWPRRPFYWTMQPEGSSPTYVGIANPHQSTQRGLRRRLRGTGKRVALGQKRAQEQAKKPDARKLEDHPAESAPFTISTLIDNVVFASTLADTGCTSYGVIDERFARRHKLQRIPTLPREVIAFDGDQGTTTSEIIAIRTDINRHTQ